MKKILFLLIPLSLSAQLAAGEWDYQAELYLQAVNIKGDTSIGPVVSDIDLDSGDILSNLDLGGMLHFEALNNTNNLGFLIDYAFMDLDFNTTAGAGHVKANADVRQAVLEALIFKRTPLNEGSIDYFGGMRWWDNNIDVSLKGPIQTNPSAKKEVDWVDFVLGARWINPINEQWNFIAKGDVGAGGADFTSSIAFGAHYRMADSFTLDLQYKASWVDYDEGSKNRSDYFAYDTVTHGPLVGVIYHF